MPAACLSEADCHGRVYKRGTTSSGAKACEAGGLVEAGHGREVMKSRPKVAEESLVTPPAERVSLKYGEFL